MRKTVIAIALMAAGLAGCATAKQTAEQRFFEAGNTPVDVDSMTWIGSWTATSAMDGTEYTLEFLEENKGSITWKGTKYIGEWKVQDGKLCTAWKELRDTMACGTVFGDDEGYRVYAPNGTLGATKFRRM